MTVEKMVRDLIPELVRQADAADTSFRRARARDRRHWLLEKLIEETQEVVASPSVEELADVLEVLHALASELGVSSADVERVRVQKRADRGGFSEGWILRRGGGG